MVAIPLGHGRIAPQPLDNLPPPDAGVVRAEGDLADGGRVGDEAHLRALEVVVPDVLEPHPRDEEDQPVVALAVGVVSGPQLPAW